MPLRGAAIGPDAVVVWTGTRELTRFDRNGTRTSFTIPVPPLASKIDAGGLRVVDDLGTLHRYTLAGAHAGATHLASVPTDIKAAALAATCDRIALVAGEEAAVYEDGEPIAWLIERNLDGYREIGVDLSADGELLLVAYETFSYFDGYGSAGHSGTGFVVLDRAGGRTIEQYDWSSSRDATAVLSPDGKHVLCDEPWAKNSRYVYAVGADGVDWAVTYTSPLQLAFHGPHVAVLLDAELVVIELATRRRASLVIPERFTDVVFAEHDVVLVHAELGAWWIPTSTLMFEADT
jgi:hypothetical protein